MTQGYDTEGRNFEHVPESLVGKLNRDDISMDLTSAGLLTGRAESIAEIYAETLDWTKTKEIYHERRVADRGSRDSAQKIFNVIRDRFQAAGDSLPSIPQLSVLYSACDKERDKDQITYLYLINADRLVRFTVHQLLRDQGLENSEWKFDYDRLTRYLGELQFRDGGELDYADSTLERWAQGFRSVMHDIGVRDSAQSNTGHPPGVGQIPLIVSAGYGWKMEGEDWQERPIGWMYLFQPRHHWDQLFNRIGQEPSWTARQVRNRVLLRPTGDPFDTGGGPR